MLVPVLKYHTIICINSEAGGSGWLHILSLERTPVSQRIGGSVDRRAGLSMVTKRRIAARNHVSFSNMIIRIVQSCFVVYQSQILRQYMSKYYRHKCILSIKWDDLGITNIWTERKCVTSNSLFTLKMFLTSLHSNANYQSPSTYIMTLLLSII